MNQTSGRARRLRHLIHQASLIALLVPSLLSAQIETEKIHSREAAAREVLIKLREGLSVADLGTILLENDISASNTIGGIGYALLRSKTKSAGELLERLRKDPRIEFAEPNYIIQGPAVHSATIPNDP